MILNRVVVDGITYLIYTNYSSGGLGATGYEEQYYVMQYTNANWNLIGSGMTGGHGGGHYTRFEDGQAIEDQYFESGEEQKLKSYFFDMGIDIITMFDDDTPEIYNVRNADAFSILAVDIDAEHQDGGRSGTLTYTVTDGTNLRNMPEKDNSQNSGNEEELYKAYLKNQLQVHRIGTVSMSGTLYAKKDWPPEVVGDWLEADGYIAADIYDYDGDGVKDLLLIDNGISASKFGEKDNAFSTSYKILTIENGEVEYKDVGSTMAFFGQHSTDDVWAVFNRVEVEDTCYLVYTTGSCTVLDESLAEVRYTVAQYDGKEFKNVLEGISYARSGGTAYWLYENDSVSLGPDEIATFKSLFKELGIDIVMRYDEDYKEDYVVRNEDAVFIASIRTDAQMDGDMQTQDCTGVITYTVNDGTDLHSIAP